MSHVIVYSFAVEDDLPPVVGAAVYEVLARQIPRLVVNLMNGAGDSGIRFFPLLGMHEGRRQFFTIPEMLSVDRVMTLHGQNEPVSFLVDGKIEKIGLTFRVHDGEAREVMVQTVGFDPLEPLRAVAALLFELTGVLGWSGVPPELPLLGHPALSYYLVAKDDLLCLEAGFVREDHDQWVRAIAAAFDHCPTDSDVQTLMLDICRHLVRARTARAQVVGLLMHAASHVDDPAFLGPAAVILDDMDQRDEADTLFERLVLQPPVSEAVSVRVAGCLFRQNRFADGRDHLERARECGVEGVRSLAQLSVLYQHLDQREKRRRVIDELAEERELPISVARMVCSELVVQGRIREGLRVIELCQSRNPTHPGLWLEKARALLHGQNSSAARPALDAALRLDPPPAIRREVIRLMRIAHVPGILPTLREIETALTQGDLEQSLRLANALCRDRPEIAESWLFLGVAWQRLDDSRRAIRALRRAVSIDDDLGEAHNRLGILLVGTGLHQEGFKQLERAIACLPDESGPRIHMAQACFLLGQPEAAQLALREAGRLGASPDDIESVRRAFRNEAR